MNDEQTKTWSSTLVSPAQEAIEAAGGCGWIATGRMCLMRAGHLPEPHFGERPRISTARSNPETRAFVIGDRVRVLNPDNERHSNEGREGIVTDVHDRGPRITPLICVYGVEGGEYLGRYDTRYLALANGACRPTATALTDFERAELEAFKAQRDILGEGADLAAEVQRLRAQLAGAGRERPRHDVAEAERHRLLLGVCDSARRVIEDAEMVGSLLAVEPHFVDDLHCAVEAYDAAAADCASAAEPDKHGPKGDE